MAKKLERNFVSPNLSVNSYSDIRPYFNDLKNRSLSLRSEIWEWLLDRSELESILSEDLAWRYIKMNCDTANEELAERFNTFVTEIEPEIAIVSNELDKKFYTDEILSKVDSTKLFTVLRELKKEIEIFREENVPLEAELQSKEQKYGVISSKMLITYNNDEITLPKAANYLKENDRNVRKEVYKLINDRRLQDKDLLNELLSELISIRQKIAVHADYKNYRDYKFRAMSRFDYTVDDCKDFHNAIAETVKPIINDLHLSRKDKLGLDILRPWDLDADVNNKPPLKPFNNAEELIRKTTFVFRDLELEFGMYLNEMKNMGYLDIESRKNKAPGGFNYPLHESNVPFIFMNATGNLRDVVTMLHEGGHAVHAYLCADLELVEFKETPAEIAELASMSMELITMDYWHYYFESEEELKRAKRIHLQDVLTVLPWVATIDKFQHFLYENPDHTLSERKEKWLAISKELGSDIIDYSGIEEYRGYQWQKQLHIYEVPFYYIEYGIAQLGAIAVWKNYKEDKQKAIHDFKEALKMGFTAPISHVYQKAGIQFNFSKEYIQELMDFVKAELIKLK